MGARLGRPDLTQRWVRWAMRTAYGPGADGLPGNDDGGAMSAWWIFAMLRRIITCGSPLVLPSVRTYSSAFCVWPRTPSGRVPFKNNSPAVPESAMSCAQVSRSCRLVAPELARSRR